MRIVVTGTYRSGSSAIAGVLHYLGVEMGAPFQGQHFESSVLAAALRNWWQEPQLVASISSRGRVGHLRRFVEMLEKRTQTQRPVGAKHPLLPLCLEDLVRSWGADVKFVWCRRPLQESTASLENLGWWPNAKEIQIKLHRANETFFSERKHTECYFADTQLRPRYQVQKIIDSLGLTPTIEEQRNAVDWLKQRQLIDDGRLIKDATETKKPQVGRLIGTSPSSAPQHALPTDGKESTERGDTEARSGEASKIVATVLSGNSGPIVGDALKSIIGFADQVCLIDTGITDDSIEIARSIVPDNLVVKSFPWCNDFSAARNFALASAHELGAQWALTLDTDERLIFRGLHNQDDLRKLLQSDEGIDAWMVRTASGGYAKERFIRLPSRAKWSGRTHESLVGTRARRHLKACLFWEQAKSTSEFQAKVERDLAILLDETQREPLNPRWWYYLGQTYQGLKQFRKAVAAFHCCITLDGWPDESSWACYNAARCMISLGEFREAEEYCLLGMSRKPTAPELPWLASWCCYQRGEYNSSIYWSELAIFNHDQATASDPPIFRHVPAWYEAPYDILRHAFEQLKNRSKAKAAHQAYSTQLARRLIDNPQPT